MKTKDPRRIYLFYRGGLALIFSLVFTTSSLYHIEMVHLNALQLVLVGTALEVTHFLCEIPTGIVADRFSRKLSILIGLGLVGLGLFLEGAVQSFAIILVAQVIWGLGDTFTSGADTAWILDEIGEERMESLFLKGAQISQLTSLLGIFISMGLAMLRPNLPFYLSGLVCLFLIFVLLRRMPETRFIPKSDFTSWHSGMFTALKEGTRILRAKHILIAAGAVMFFEGLYSEGFDRLWTAHFLDQLHHISSPGREELWLLGVNLFATIFGILLMGFLERRSERFKAKSLYGVLFLLNVGKSISILLFALLGNVWGVAFVYCIGNSLRNSFYPLYDAWVNRQVEDPEWRATSLSMLGQLNSIGQISGGPLLGWIALKVGVPIGLVLSGFLVIPIIMIYGGFYLKRSSEKMENAEGPSSETA